MLQIVGLFGALCLVIGVLRVVGAPKAADPKKAKSSAIAVTVFALLLIGISLFGAPIAIRLSGL